MYKQLLLLCSCSHVSVPPFVCVPVKSRSQFTLVSIYHIEFVLNL